MIAVIQRAQNARVLIEDEEHSSIKSGLLILLGIEEADGEEDINWLARKVTNLRIFNDQDGVMNYSCLDVGAEVMVVSQFTLHASTKKGNRPSYIKAAKPDVAIPIYEQFILEVERIIGSKVATGVFGAMMDVSFTNTGPVTIMIDTKDKK